jgi:hypothetical protein
MTKIPTRFLKSNAFCDASIWDGMGGVSKFDDQVEIRHCDWLKSSRSFVVPAVEFPNYQILLANHIAQNYPLIIKSMDFAKYSQCG